MQAATKSPLCAWPERRKGRMRQAGPLEVMHFEPQFPWSQQHPECSGELFSAALRTLLDSFIKLEQYFCKYSWILQVYLI